MDHRPWRGSGPIIAVDIKAGSPRGGRATYSVVLLSGGEKRYLETNRSGLLATIKRVRPSLLAVDNIYEIVGSSGELAAFLRELPDDVRVVQVTGPFGGGEGLERIARREGLWDGGKMDPKRSAEVIAELAARGYGAEVAGRRSECRVLITKNRSVRQGGSGTERWRRSIESGILSEANDLAAALDRAGIDYDLYVEKGAGGLKRAEFVVYAPKSVVRQMVREHEWGPIRVTLRDSWKRTLEVSPGRRGWERRPVAVGIDPGMSVGLAVMDLEGRILSLQTIRRASRSEIIEAIVEHGYPVIITTDTFPTPKSVQKVAQMVGARLLTVRETMRVDEKNRLVREFSEREGIRVGSSHERDALAPLIRIMMRYKNLFKKADAYVRERKLRVSKVRMYELLMRGYSISEAARLASSGGGVMVVPREAEIAARKRESRGRTRRISERIKILEEEISYLRDLVREKEREVEELRRALEDLKREMSIEVRRERLISALEGRIRELEERLRREMWRNELLRSEMRSIASQGDVGDGWIGVKFVESLARDVLEEAISRGEVVKGDVLLTFDASVAGMRSAKMLASLGISGLIIRGPYPSSDVMTFLEGAGIPIVDGFDVRIAWRGITPLVREEVAAEIARARREAGAGKGPGGETGSVLRILEEYRSGLSGGDDRLNTTASPRSGDG